MLSIRQTNLTNKEKLNEREREIERERDRERDAQKEEKEKILKRPWSERKT